MFRALGCRGYFRDGAFKRFIGCKVRAKGLVFLRVKVLAIQGLRCRAHRWLVLVSSMQHVACRGIDLRQYRIKG